MVEFSTPRFSGKKPKAPPPDPKTMRHHCPKYGGWVSITPYLNEQAQLLTYNCRACQQKYVTTREPREARALTSHRDSWTKWAREAALDAKWFT